ncbi:hypothetical protein [Devosia sp.]|uniref:hypothetical protein n=1 Tax=Devosia sp. TaxID=1871048 RepID=UPI0032639488
MLIGAIIVLTLLIAGVVTLILLDMRSRGWVNWLGVLDNWQSTIGTVVGFLSAAAVLVLGTALNQQSQQQHADVVARNLGRAFAYEAERMATALELGRQLGLQVDMGKTDLLATQCSNIARTLKEQLQRETPVFEAGITHLVDIGPDDLASFVRFHAFYADLRQSLDSITDATCAEAAEAQIGYMSNQMRIGLGYYARFAPQYDIVQFSPDGVLEKQTETKP